MRLQLFALMYRYRLFIWSISLAMLGWSAASAQVSPLPDGKLLHFVSPHTAFPDTGRRFGHVYDSVLYDAPAHYQDSQVLILVPDRLDRSGAVDMIFWFHGWRNNIDTALQYYHLSQQFLAAHRQAVLVMAETAKNSPDSYGGKLETAGLFRALVGDVLSTLKQNQVITTSAHAGNILLAGHSGAYRVIARILDQGGVEIREVNLFDALYAETDIFLHWIRQDSTHRFINWYTNVGGGTDEVSKQMMEQLKEAGTGFGFTEEAALSPAILRANRLVFVHSAREHNDCLLYTSDAADE